MPDSADRELSGGEVIVRALRERGLSGNSFAKILHRLNPGVSEASYRRAISRWKRGEIPQGHNRALLAVALGISEDSLAARPVARMEMLEAAQAQLEQRLADLEARLRALPPQEQ
jgi:hypothetical protein